MSDEADNSGDGTKRQENNQQPLNPLAADLELEVSDAVDEDDGDEFTLETLSEAYADVTGEGRDNDVDDQLHDESSERDEEGNAIATASDPQPAVDDDAACAISPESIVESILFVGSPSDVRLTSKKIAAVLRDVSPKEVVQIVRKLNARYEEQNAAWRIATEKGNYRMVLHESLDSFKDEYFGRNREIKLNQAAIDVLAVVAYHQPASREDVDKARGKSSGSVLNQLVKRQLLSHEKSEGTPARKLYRTTDRFLDLFGLTEIEDLPQSHEVADIEDLAD